MYYVFNTIYGYKTYFSLIRELDYGNIGNHLRIKSKVESHQRTQSKNNWLKCDVLPILRAISTNTDLPDDGNCHWKLSCSSIFPQSHMSDRSVEQVHEYYISFVRCVRTLLVSSLTKYLSYFLAYADISLKLWRTIT